MKQVQKTPPTTKSAAPSPRLPTLRAALWLYLFVLLGTTLTVYVPAHSAPRVLLGLVSGLFVVGGFTLAGIFINQFDLWAMVGARPRWRTLAYAFLAGVAIWIPAYWLTVIVSALLNVNVGLIQGVSAAQLDPNAALPPLPVALLVALVILPVSQGLLFWGYLRHGLDGIGPRWTTILLVLMFAVFGMYATTDGMAGIAEFLLVGILAALVAHFTGTVWNVVAVLAGYNLAPFLTTSILGAYFASHPDDAFNPFSERWLILVVVGVFVSFILIQILRAIGDEKKTPAITPAPLNLGRWWWVPVALSLGITLGLGYFEITQRMNNPIPYGTNPTGSTVPPIGSSSSPGQ